MGQTSTRRRTLDPNLRPITRRFYVGGSLFETKLDYSGTSSLSVPRQLTTSYRTERRNKARTPEDITKSEVEDFLDVTRNGFTEPSPNYDNGHEFFTSKSLLQTSHPNWVFAWQDPSSASFSYKQNGPLFFNVPQTVSYGGGGVPYLDLESTRLPADVAKRLGTQLIADTIPTKGPVQLSAILGEAMAGLPKLLGIAALKDGSTLHQQIGDEFLNWTFGVAPTLDDVKDLMGTVARISKTVQQYHRDSGRNVRRRRSMPPSESVVVTHDVPVPPNNGPRLVGWDNGALSIATQLNLTETTTIRTWFSGAYTYHLADSNSVVDRFRRFEEDANAVLGTRLTWDVLWQLSPWSWLADWFGNVGDLLTNVSYLGSDGLVLRYGYLMNHTKVVRKYSMPDGATFRGGAKTGPISNTLTIESKERVRSTPYGFGLSTSGLSAKQWAIIGALGLTRAPKVMF